MSLPTRSLAVLVALLVAIVASLWLPWWTELDSSYVGHDQNGWVVPSRGALLAVLAVACLVVVALVAAERPARRSMVLALRVISLLLLLAAASFLAFPAHHPPSDLDPVRPGHVGADTLPRLGLWVTVGGAGLVAVLSHLVPSGSTLRGSGFGFRLLALLLVAAAVAETVPFLAAPLGKRRDAVSATIDATFGGDGEPGQNARCEFAPSFGLLVLHYRYRCDLSICGHHLARLDTVYEALSGQWHYKITGGGYPSTGRSGRTHPELSATPAPCD